MSRKAKSQWDFGELFPPEQTRRVLSVSELTGQVKRMLEQQVGTVWVSGEISNFRLQGSSGHIYFTLKDAGAQLACVLFRQAPVAHRGLMGDGQKVLLQGEVTVYAARGQYQLLVRAVELQGVGALQLKFEQLKQKLAAQGWFDAERKRAVPRYPRRLGLVTSPSGAAMQDVLRVIQRRDPGLAIILAPCRVQGVEAPREIAAAIGLLNEWSAAMAKPGKASKVSGARSSRAVARGAGLDLILVTRGGGSLEDLWAFNEEVVARAIYDSSLPVISAVGHEIDFTIADFVADVRAATPSAAAEIITEGVFASRELVFGAIGTMTFHLRRHCAVAREDWKAVTRRFARAHPERWLGGQAQRLDDLRAALARRAQQGTREQLAAWRSMAGRLRRMRPDRVLAQHRERLRSLGQRLVEQGRARWRTQRDRLHATAARVHLLGPEQVLARGYSITWDAQTGDVVRDAQQVKPGQSLRTRLHSGEIRSTAV
ncbi:MAG TPA: exodeoxyribonuclease VII large subunit [Verrucomicrobiota bacterium]|nr:exodeoxyribonuclease VII large subunit [Verrucomicrobiota bacterium]HNT15513.1 exodeoxyribonuclease VII large subunit [Verrucomicrobiota bacterium]